MKWKAGIATIACVIGTFALPARAAAESKQEQQARCTAYAERAVAQYNEAIAHPQCAINVDLVWQPSTDFHFKACMAMAQKFAEGTQANRDSVLQACASGPAASPVSAALPTVINECDTSLLKFCGTWTLSGQQYAASWSDGAKATLAVQRYDGHSIALHRIDGADSSHAGMTADYLGTVEGGTMKGKVTYTWTGHVPPVGYGTWKGTFDPAALTTATTTPAPASANLSGEYVYLGRGVATITQTGDDVHMFATWTPFAGGPHYEMKAKLVGDTLVGEWYSNYAHKGWYRLIGRVHPDGAIDLSGSDDPIGSNIKTAVLTRKH